MPDVCRFVAYLGPPRSLHELLVDPPHSLLRQSYAPRHQQHGVVNADGFGVGWYDPSARAEPARHRTEKPMWADRTFASLAGIVRSGAVLAAVRSATPPAPVEESGAPPFTWGPWLFAHNGAVDGWRDGVGSAIRRLVPECWAAGIEGAADSEVLFALALSRIADGTGPAVALASVVQAVSELADARLNMVLTDGRAITATAWGDSLWVLDGPEGRTVASEPSDDDGPWQPVPDRSLVRADALSLDVGPIPGTP